MATTTLCYQAPPARHVPSLSAGDRSLSLPRVSGQLTYHDAFDLAREFPSHSPQDLAAVLPGAPACPRCTGYGPCPTIQRRLSPHDAKQGLIGTVAYLPSFQDAQAAGSCIFGQPHVNPAAFQHPCVILETSACGHLSFCAPVTSFGGNSLADKYARASRRTQERFFWEYIAMEGVDGTHSPVNDLGTLRIAGAQLEKRSYCHLAEGYWIEWDNLSRFNKMGRRVLDAESIQLVRWAYAVAEHHRSVIGIQDKFSPSSSPVKKIPPPLLQLPSDNFALPPVWQQVPVQQMDPFAQGFVIPKRGSHAIAIVAPPSPPASPTKGLTPSWAQVASA